MSDSEADAFESRLETVFVEEHGADAEIARSAAGKAAAFREEYDEGLSVDRVSALVSEAPYEVFGRRFDAAIGELAAETEDCTDSREYRLSGFGEKGADPTIGT